MRYVKITIRADVTENKPHLSDRPYTAQNEVTFPLIESLVAGINLNPVVVQTVLDALKALEQGDDE